MPALFAGAMWLLLCLYVAALAQVTWIEIGASLWTGSRRGYNISGSVLAHIHFTVIAFIFVFVQRLLCATCLFFRERGGGGSEILKTIRVRSNRELTYIPPIKKHHMLLRLS